MARLNVAPRPLLETQMAYTLARVVMVATKVGAFDALAEGPATPREVAERCGTSAVGTAKLLFALAGAGYVRADGDRYALTPVSRKWLLRSSPHSIADKLLFQFDEWEWIEGSEDYVRTGEPLEVHSMIGDEHWQLYQRGMRAMANAFADEAVRRMPVPKGAGDMLDIGGSHGYYSALCRRHEGLRSTILDLPSAVEHAAPLLAAEGMGDRVTHRAGDALSDDLGGDAYDLVLVAQLVHFSDSENRELATRIARALRPGGVYAVLDAFRPRSAGDAGQVGPSWSSISRSRASRGPGRPRRSPAGSARPGSARGARFACERRRASASRRPSSPADDRGLTGGRLAVGSRPARGGADARAARPQSRLPSRPLVRRSASPGRA